jgi:hypothetical protein
MSAYTYMIARAQHRNECLTLSPPEYPTKPRRRDFADRDVDAQWSCIREWMERHGHGAEVMAEAHQFHKNCSAIMAARFAGDHATAARLIEEAQREYLGELVQKDWDSQS